MRLALLEQCCSSFTVWFLQIYVVLCRAPQDEQSELGIVAGNFEDLKLGSSAPIAAGAFQDLELGSSVPIVSGDTESECRWTPERLASSGSIRCCVGRDFYPKFQFVAL